MRVQDYFVPELNFLFPHMPYAHDILYSNIVFYTRTAYLSFLNIIHFYINWQHLSATP